MLAGGESIALPGSTSLVNRLRQSSIAGFDRLKRINKFCVLDDIAQIEYHKAIISESKPFPLGNQEELLKI